MQNKIVERQMYSLGGGKCLQYRRRVSVWQMFENHEQLIIWKTMKVKVKTFFPYQGAVRIYWKGFEGGLHIEECPDAL